MKYSGKYFSWDTHITGYLQSCSGEDAKLLLYHFELSQL